MPRPTLLVASPDESFCSQLRGQLEGDYRIMVSTHLSSLLSLLRDEDVDFLIADQRWELSDGAVIDRVLTMLYTTAPHARGLVFVGKTVPEKLAPHAVENPDRIVLLSGFLTIERVAQQLHAWQGGDNSQQTSISADQRPEPETGKETLPSERHREQPSLPSQRFEKPNAEVPTSANSSIASGDLPIQTKLSAISPSDSAQTARSEKSGTLAKGGESVFSGVTRHFETRSPQMKQMLDDLMVAAGHDVTILLIGETGAGKTFLSNLVHEASPRRTEPFIHVACGALPRDLLESELFGHAKGAFTSAHADKEGKFIAARNGTILLDEIDVLAPEQQVKLLRVIETGEFEPVGSNQTLTSQARLVVASNLDLEPLVMQGKFRPDLYYRLNMMKFDLLPLRKRKVDVIPLCKKFIAKFQEKHRITISRIDDTLLDAVLSYPWPGNVRELEHVMQRAVIYCKDGVLTREHLPPNILAGQVGPTNDPTIQLGRMDLATDQSLEQQVALSEKEIIEQTLLKNNYSRTNTARELGISRVTLYNKMKKYEMMK